MRQRGWIGQFNHPAVTGQFQVNGVSLSFVNSGGLTLTAYFANPVGRTVSSVAVLQGVPARNGTVAQLSDTAVTKITPAAGEHFYYVRVTQDDGKILWSAPLWVTQTDAAAVRAPMSD